jgi:O-antigen ligase
MSRLVKPLIPIFLIINLGLRISLLSNENIFVKGLFLLGILVCIFVFFQPKFLKLLLFVFALSFPLYGWHSFSTRNFIFEFLVTVIAITLYLIYLKEPDSLKVNKILLKLILLYISLSFFSILLFPLDHIGKIVSLWGVKGFSNVLFTSTPDSYFYSLAALNRLLLFFAFIYLLSIHKKSRNYYQVLFIGALIGGVGSAILGILNQFGVTSLDWYQLWSFGNRLQSVFGNPGWFSEFLCVVIPFILFVFLLKTKGWAWKCFLFLILIICGIAIILTGSRTGWLIYPLVLILGLSFYYLFKESDKKRKSWKNKSKIIVKVLIAVPITILISIFILLQIIEKPKPSIHTVRDVYYNLRFEDDYHTFLSKRLSERGSIKIRQILWKGGIALGIERPIFGMGYESYGWHAKILGSIQKSPFYKNYLGKFIDTPHSTFIQFFISGGIVGLILWMSMIVFALWILIVNIRKEKNFFNIAVFLSIIGFFLYGFAQSMQYIAVIWFLIFLNVGYAMTINDSILNLKQQKIWKLWANICLVAVVFGGVIYSMNLESKMLAKKYGLTIYAQDQSFDRYQGFYHLEKSSFGPFRWSGKRGVVKLFKEGVVEFKYICLHPNVEKEPVMLSVYLNEEKIDFITFNNKGEKSRQYYFSNLKNDSLELLFEVSRTWNPRKYGINADTRDLGIGISPLKILKGFPKEDVGFYPYENWKTKPIGWPKEKPLKIRWAGIRASIKIKKEDKRRGMILYVLASHPDLSDQRPVTLKICGDSIELKVLNLKKFWQEVKLEPKQLINLEVLTFQVNRTWNPKSSKISLDNRDLGVAIAKLE